MCADRPGAVKETRDEAMLLRSMCHSPLPAMKMLTLHVANCGHVTTACNMLESPGSIVKVHDFFDNGTSVYFVMDRMHQDLLDGHFQRVFFKCASRTLHPE